jgi:hypothetical protein
VSAIRARNYSLIAKLRLPCLVMVARRNWTLGIHNRAARAVSSGWIGRYQAWCQFWCQFVFGIPCRLVHLHAIGQITKYLGCGNADIIFHRGKDASTRTHQNSADPKSHASGTVHKDMLRGVFGATYASQSAGVF